MASLETQEQVLKSLLNSHGNQTDTAITDPTLSASEIAVLKGLLKQLQGTGTGAAPVTLNGRNVTNTADLQATFEDDGTGKGLLRVFLASVLDAAQDSVAIAGARADSLYRRLEDTIEKSGTITLAAAGQSGDYVEIVNTTSAIVIDLFEVALASDNELDLRVEIYTKQSDGTESVYEMVRWDGSKPRAVNLILGYVPLGDVSYSNSFGQEPYFVRSMKTDTDPKYHKIWLRENKRLEMPRGGRIRLANINSTGSRNIAYHIRYGVYAI